MRFALALAVPFVLSACAAPPSTSDTDPGHASEIHPQFAALRPVMVQVRVDGEGESAKALARAVYDGLIAKGYSVLAPGVSGGEEIGVFRAVLSGAPPGWSGKAAMEDPFGTVIYRSYRSVVDVHTTAMAAMARELLRDLPPK